jgi:ATP-dependent DNA ligase
MLHKRLGINVTLFVFDVLAVEGLSTTMQPYRERRANLEQLELERPARRVLDAVVLEQRHGVTARKKPDGHCQ